MRSLTVVLSFLIIQWLFVLSPVCADESRDDLLAIRELLVRLEQGYEDRDVEKYVSVFSDEQYEYVSDMTTPEDPSDDIHLLEVESERRAAIRIFKAYENIDLKATEPEIIINGNSAEARNEIDILFVTFGKSSIPQAYYAASSNTFSLRRIKGEWGIVHWNQHEMSAEELKTRRQTGLKDKGVEELLQDLGDEHLQTWTAAMGTLRKRRVTIVDRLIEALHSSDKNMRVRTAKILYGTRDEAAVQALMRVLNDERDDIDVRVVAANALSDCEGQEVDSSLLAAAKGNDPEVKSAAFLALARRTRKQLDSLYQISATGIHHEDEVVREAAAEALGIIMSVGGANILEQRFRDENESESVRLAALESLKQMKSESVLQLFRDVLKDRHELLQIRIHASRALAEAKDHNALELLVDVAKSKKETLELRKEAISSLGVMGDPDAVKPLLSMLDSSDVDLRRETVRSLEKLGDRRALKPLMMVIMNRNEDIFVRRLAGGGIVKIDRDIAFGPLTQIMNDKTEIAPARRMAAERLMSYKDDRAIQLFAEMLIDQQQPWWLRRIAANRLNRVSANADPTTLCMEALRTASSDPDERIASIGQEALDKINTGLSVKP